MLMRKNGNNDVGKDSPIGQMLLDGEGGAGNEHGDPESEKWEQNRIGNEITGKAYRLGFTVGHL